MPNIHNRSKPQQQPEFLDEDESQPPPAAKKVYTPPPPPPAAAKKVDMRPQDTANAIRALNVMVDSIKRARETKARMLTADKAHTDAEMTLKNAKAEHHSALEEETKAVEAYKRLV